MRVDPPWPHLVASQAVARRSILSQNGLCVCVEPGCQCHWKRHKHRTLEGEEDRTRHSTHVGHEQGGSARSRGTRPYAILWLCT